VLIYIDLYRCTYMTTEKSYVYIYIDIHMSTEVLMGIYIYIYKHMATEVLIYLHMTTEILI